MTRDCPAGILSLAMDNVRHDHVIFTVNNTDLEK